MKSAKETEPNCIPAAWASLLQVSVEEVFEIMLGLKLASFRGTTALHDLTAMVGLAGKLRGVLTVRCTYHAASLMTAKMLGGNANHNSEHTLDALGEMCNMIAGNFKNKLPELADGCLLSVPTVISGRDYKLRPLANSETLELILEFEGNPLIITLDVHT